MLNEIINQILNIFNGHSIKAIVSVLGQLFIIFAILYGIFRKFIKGTSSEKLVHGIFILIIGWLIGEILIKLNLNILGTFIRGSIGVVAISLIVIFQPELRKFLNFLGQTDFLKKIFLINTKKEE